MSRYHVIVGMLSVCFLFVPEARSVDAANSPTEQQPENAEFVDQRSFSPLSKTPLKKRDSGVSMAATLIGNDTYDRLLVDPSGYASYPNVFEIDGEVVQIYQRLADGIPFEDSYFAVYQRPGYPPRYFHKGTAPITKSAPKIDFDQAFELAKRKIAFDPALDKDYTRQQDHMLFYRFSPKSKKYHLVYTFLFFSNRLNDFVHVKVDIHTGDIVMYQLLRSYADPKRLQLRSNVYERHPLTSPFLRGLSNAKVAIPNGEEEIVLNTDADGWLNMEHFAETGTIVTENNSFSVGSATGTSALPISPFELDVKRSDLINWKGNLGNQIPMSVGLPFYFLQKIKSLATTWMPKISPSYALPVSVDYRPLNGSCNAYFGWEVKAGDTLLRPSHFVFYDASAGACRAAGQFASIVIHEYGHFLDYQAGGIADSASSEGFADITSMLYLRKPFIAPHFRPTLQNHFIRDLRVDRHDPLHRGEVHFEGQILASAFWDLILQWQSLYSTDWVYQSLKSLFFRALLMASHARDLPQVLTTLLARTPELPSPNHLQCSINQVFANHGLVDEDKTCQKQTPSITITLDPEDYRQTESGQSYLPSGESIHVSVRVTSSTPYDTKTAALIKGPYLVGTLWMDDELLARHTVGVSELVRGPNDFESVFEFPLPVSASKNHRYTLRVAYSDLATTIAASEISLPINRVYLETARYHSSPEQTMDFGMYIFPINLGRRGFIENAPRFEFHVSSPNDSLPISIAARARSGNQAYLAVLPPSLNTISNQDMTLNYRFQGEATDHLSQFIIVHRRPLGEKLTLHNYEVTAPIYLEVTP